MKVQALEMLWIFINVAYVQHRVTTTMDGETGNMAICYSKSIENDVIQIQSRSMSDPTLSGIDFENQMAWI